MSELEQLVAASVPRDRELVEWWTGAVAKATRKLARGIGLWFIAAILLSAVVILCAALSADRDGDVGFAIEFSALMMLFMGIVPAWAIRRVLERDVRATRRIVRDGIACEGHVIAHQRLGYGGLHIIDLGWIENAKNARARFDIDKIELTGSERIVVLAIPKTKAVAAVFGDRGMFVGRRH